MSRVPQISHDPDKPVNFDPVHRAEAAPNVRWQFDPKALHTVSTAPANAMPDVSSVIKELGQVQGLDLVQARTKKAKSLLEAMFTGFGLKHLPGFAHCTADKFAAEAINSMLLQEIEEHMATVPLEKQVAFTNEMMMIFKNCKTGIHDVEAFEAFMAKHSGSTKLEKLYEEILPDKVVKGLEEHISLNEKDHLVFKSMKRRDLSVEGQLVLPFYIFFYVIAIFLIQCSKAGRSATKDLAALLPNRAGIRPTGYIIIMIFMPSLVLCFGLGLVVSKGLEIVARCIRGIPFPSISPIFAGCGRFIRRAVHRSGHSRTGVGHPEQNNVNFYESQTDLSSEIDLEHLWRNSMSHASTISVPDAVYRP